ncbi:MAG: hypothetical protein DMG57_38310 [Acidobacteria bacterium]|nr:MAG: hypothetical protein DMG57_38310 [Acidobacteriota bacterium]
MGKVALIVTETATNLFKHAAEGQLIVRPLCSGNESGLEIMTVDRDPGIGHVHECLRDGYSTAGSPGTGLGAISRLSSTFDIYSAPGKGTTLFSEIRKAPGACESSLSAPASPMRVGCFSISIAKPGEDVNGDNWATEKNRCWGGFRRRGRRGEWPGRRAGIERGSAGFWRTSWTAACGNSRAIHSGLRPTRGAAIALAHANADEGVVR